MGHILNYDSPETDNDYPLIPAELTSVPRKVAFKPSVKKWRVFGIALMCIVLGLDGLQARINLGAMTLMERTGVSVQGTVTAKHFYHSNQRGSLPYVDYKAVLCTRPRALLYCTA